jgi:protocatechuate 3,4-dioxygenase beta subunit
LALVAAAAIAILRATAAPREPGPAPAPAARPTRDPFARSEQVAIARDPDPEGGLALAGLVVGPDGTPAGGAAIVINSAPPREVTADDRGGFAIAGLAPRDYEVMATRGRDVAGPVHVRLTAASEPVVLELRPGATLAVTVVRARSGQPAAGATVQLRGALPRTATTDASGQAQLVALPLGAQRVVAWGAGLGRAEAPVFFGDDGRAEAVRLALTDGARVGGVVLGPSGAPAAGARVSIESAAEPWWRAPDPADVAITDAAGRFALAPVPLGGYRVRADHADLAPATSPLLTITADRDDVALQLRPGLRLAGRVVDASGAPAAGARVRLTAAAAAGEAREVAADALGGFTFGGLAPGRVELAAAGDGATSALTPVELPRAGSAELVITLGDTAALAGVVVDERGEPVAGAAVSAWPDAGASAWWILVGMHRERSAADGTFQLRGLARHATYAVSADRPEAIARGLGMRGPPVRARPGERPLRLVVATPGRVEGKVAFDDGSHPALFTVRLTGSSRQPRPFADPGGRFAIPDVPPGEYSLAVEGPGFEAFHYEGIRVVAGSITDLGTVPARPGRRIEGRVVDGRGAPVGGARVGIGHALIGTGRGDEEPGAFAGRARTAETAPDGTFAIAGVGRGTVTVIAAHPAAGRSAPIELPAAAGATQHVELVLAAQGAVAGRIVGDLATASGAMVTAQSTTAPMMVQMARAGADGQFRFDALAADRYAVSIGAGTPLTGMRFTGRVVAVQAGQTTQLELSPAAGTATLVVTAELPAGASHLVMVFTTRGELGARSASEVLRAVTSGAVPGARAGDIEWAWAASPAGQPVAVRQLVPGHYTACAVGLAVPRGSLPDLASLLRETDLAATCRAVDVPAAGASVTVAIAP